jgi:replicative DNA helicase
MLLQDMAACGDPVDDVAAVAERMKARGIWERIGGAPWLYGIFRDGAVHRFHVDFYAKELVRLANLRRIIEISEQTIRDAYDQSADPEKIGARATSQLAARLEIRDDIHRLDKLAAEMIEELDAPTKEHQPLFTGWPAFDVKFGPFVSGESVIIGARSSIGKTAAMIQLSMYTASHGRPVLFASLEMTAREVRNRIMCALAGVDSTRYRSRELDTAECNRLKQARDKIDGWPIWIWNPTGRKTIARIAAKARSMHAEHGLKLLCIDYLGKIHHEGQRCDRQEEVASFARGVKDIAIDLDIPVVTGCQLNREADKDCEPALHMLRESGAVEQEADIVIFVHRKDRADTSGKFIVAKFRQGAPGELAMTWNPVIQEFTLEPDRVEDHHNYTTDFDRWNNP